MVFQTPCLKLVAQRLPSVMSLYEMATAWVSFQIPSFARARNGNVTMFWRPQLRLRHLWHALLKLTACFQGLSTASASAAKRKVSLRIPPFHKVAAFMIWTTAQNRLHAACAVCVAVSLAGQRYHDCVQTISATQSSNGLLLVRLWHCVTLPHCHTGSPAHRHISTPGSQHVAYSLRHHPWVTHGFNMRFHA